METDDAGSVGESSFGSGRLAIAVLGTLCLAACSSGGGGGADNLSKEGDGELVIEATDEPWVYEIVEEARISIDQVRVHPDEGDPEDDDGWIVLYEGDPVDLDLLELRNGVKRVLLRVDVDAGLYSQLRLHVSSAYLRLINGNEYSTELGNLHLTSQDTSGFKVNVDPPIEVVGGLSRSLLLDFDMTKTFHPVPASDPLNAAKYQLHPVIRVANLSDSGEVRGVVYQLVDDVQVPVPDAIVYVLPPGELDLENAIATTATDEDGSYAVLGLPVGELDVYAEKAGLSGRVDGVPIVAGNLTVADIVLQ